MKKQNRRQGFTLVELLVVIAILAILATVSVVGYTAFIKKAHESNAKAEASQVKEAIRAELIAGNEFVINETKDETSGAVTARCVIKLSGEGENKAYSVRYITIGDPGSDVAAGTEQVNAAFAANEDFKALLEHASFAVKDATAQILVYNYTANDSTISVEIDLNSLTK